MSYDGKTWSGSQYSGAPRRPDDGDSHSFRRYDESTDLDSMYCILLASRKQNRRANEVRPPAMTQTPVIEILVGGKDGTDYRRIYIEAVAEIVSLAQLRSNTRARKLAWKSICRICRGKKPTFENRLGVRLCRMEAPRIAEERDKSIERELMWTWFSGERNLTPKIFYSTRGNLMVR